MNERSRQDWVCECGHWVEEHEGDNHTGPCGVSDCECRRSRYSEEENRPEAIADRGGDPELWPQHVKDYFGRRDERTG